ncbi:relaxase domain-containing protein [Luteolibacter pohnpeiensis]|uniref:Relaxase domain-containing protein n=1 Tax=Luteolibacter pohnpeiensis TaxID=454153 RepID=A0A934SEK5_9BACT|nr:MobF family relaxase [Luteolibacter pohnpeiensis]MBK1883758.1 relaxase domain-containing protein [Luteolibacter pohnpeiensis]
MITVTQIRGGGGYMSQHLSMNDYYSEGEEVVGHWLGKAAEQLGIEGQPVRQADFEALRSNRHPQTGQKLRPRRAKVAYHDFVVSAPKSVSIAAMTGGDDRLLKAFDHCVRNTFERLEGFAAIRVRTGSSYQSEELKVTGNAVAAAFRHDTSRMLDPQLHTHLVFANLTWDESNSRWLALQPKQMAEQAGGAVRRAFYRELEHACQQLGYETERVGEAFRLKGIPQEMEALLSQRSVQRRAFEHRYTDVFGQAPDKKRIEQFIKEGHSSATKRFRKEYTAKFGASPNSKLEQSFIRDWRSAKMETSNRSNVHALQRERLGDVNLKQLDRIVEVTKRSTEIIMQPVPQQESLIKQMPPKVGSAMKSSEPKVTKKRAKVNRIEAARRLRRGMAVTRALQGQPRGIILRQISELNRKRHER